MCLDLQLYIIRLNMDECWGQLKKERKNRNETQSGNQGLAAILSFIFYFPIQAQLNANMDFFNHYYFFSCFHNRIRFLRVFNTCTPTDKMCMGTYTGINSHSFSACVRVHTPEPTQPKAAPHSPRARKVLSFIQTWFSRLKSKANG